MINSSMKGALCAALSVGLLAAPTTALPAVAGEISGTPAAAGSGVIINEAYVNGGSAGAPFRNKFVELYNPTDSAVSLEGWSLQYRSAGGTAAPGAAKLTGTIAAEGYYLIQGSSNVSTSTAESLPTPDATMGASWAAGGGVLVLADQSTSVAPLPVGSTVGHPGVVDLLGYDSTSFETAPATGPGGTSNQKSLNRTGFADTDNNASDFSLSAAVTPINASGTAGEPPPPPEPEEPPVPGAVIPIREIQGEGAASPLAGKTVTTRGKVTAAYATGGFDGYFLQTAGTGAIEGQSASDALFIYSPSTVGTVAIGDHVEVTGTVGESFGMTQLTVAAGGATQVAEAAEEVKVAEIPVPTSEAAREAVEGMLLQPTGTFTVADNYSLNQYGEIGLASGTAPLLQPTEVAPPGTAENAAVAADNAARGIKLDDGASTNFLAAANQGTALPYLTRDQPVRNGYIAGFTAPVVLDYRFSAWKFQPVTELTAANAGTVQPVTFSGSRPVAPEEVGGDLKLASFNVLNYFSTTGDQLAGCSYFDDRQGNPLTVRGGCDARGAATAASFERQEAKIVAAITDLDADVVTLMEIENSAKFGKERDSALATLTAALNERSPGVWDYVRSPEAVPALENEDVIRTALIYKKAVAEPVGDSVILDDDVAFSNARKPLAQAFKPVGGAADTTFLTIVNHFKSKGSPASSGPNADSGDGQGGWNAARVQQSTALVAFADRMKAEAKTDRVFLTGDFNSYSAEDPMQVLYEAGYLNQGTKTDKHSYVFSGLSGSLDHVLASPAADTTVAGVDTWNINSAESVALEYSRYNTNITDYHAADPYRASDHDPVIVGLNSAPAETTSELNLLNINDFHGRIDTNTVRFAGTVEKLKAAYPEGDSAFLSAGDNIGASLFPSSLQQDKPTIDVLNALELRASAVGNHEFDAGTDDLSGRVADLADFPYLGANVYAKGTTDPAFEEYSILDVGGIDVAVIGVVTEATAELVSPDGIAGVDFGDPVEAVNRVAEEIEAQDLADVIVAEYHDGAGDGAVEGSTIEQEIAAGGTFAEIATETSPLVDAIFTGHTHKQYAWDGPVPGVEGKTRPILQTGSYGEFLGQITLTVDDATGDVQAYTAQNIARTTDSDESLVSAFPRVAEVKRIVDSALAEAAVIGNQPVGSVTADITTAFNGTARDDRSSESTLGNLVADSLRSSLGSAERGGAEIGVVNPGGLRNELYYSPDGVVTFAEANAVLPFVNDLWTTTLTGAQFKEVLEQQWQPDGNSRTFLALGLSDNVSYTYDPARERGSRITSVTVDGAPLDPARAYRVGTFSFLAQGGDNFTVFRNGTDTRESGLVDRDAWIDYIEASSPLAPSFDRRGVIVQDAPSAVRAGESVSFNVSKLDLTSLGSPANSTLTAQYVAAGASTDLGSFPVSAGAAAVTVTVPENAGGAGSIVLVAGESGTTVTLPVTAEAVVPEVPAEPALPVCGKDKPGNASDASEKSKQDKQDKGEKPGKKCTPPGKGRG
ncbi:ExeM/NucH family extracellular endonuclease [Arthrobacter sp. Br18]|uniref:ExeM/NucH family extracellular endonuclease n=1 Tax=Arthrobacter sp. Br18 TaxID=1312954 RepID=UPI0004B90BC5|nr:ExeM/NucH family extracellular endonuclease [Arthrobacter sp. Br18]